MFTLPFTLRLIFASTDSTLFVARAVYAWESSDVTFVIVNVDWPLSIMAKLNGKMNETYIRKIHSTYRINESFKFLFLFIK
jgi:hypothetical protein